MYANQQIVYSYRPTVDLMMSIYCETVSSKNI